MTAAISPYRQSAEEKPPTTVVTVSGRNEATAGLVVVGGVFLAPIVAGAQGDLPGFIVLACVTLLAAIGERYKLTISTGGIDVTLYSLGLVPRKRHHFPLDAEVDLYWPLGSASPEGLCVHAPWGWGERETDCFGPSFRQARIVRVREIANEAIGHMRSAMWHEPHELRVDRIPELADALDPAGQERWPVTGRLKSARLSREFATGGVTLPAGTTVELNEDSWLDPRRPDRLRGAIVSAPTTIPLVGGHRVEAGARLWFGENGQCSSVSNAFSKPTRMGRFVVHPTKGLRWNTAGELLGFALGADVEVGGVTIPTGSRFSNWDLVSLREWYVNPAGAVSLPQLTVGALDTLRVSRDLTRVVAVGTRRDVVVDGVTLKGDIVQFPLDDELRIDVAWCQRAGLVR
jgi:hypothetical protein